METRERKSDPADRKKDSLQLATAEVGVHDEGYGFEKVRRLHEQTFHCRYHHGHGHDLDRDLDRDRALDLVHVLYQWGHVLVALQARQLPVIS